METANRQFGSIAEYVAGFSGEIRQRLETICKIIEDLAPAAEGKISYNMPAYFYPGRLVYFCAFKNHIGLYPASMAVFAAFKEELRPYKQSGRGTIQFQHGEPLPADLIRAIVEFRLKENGQSRLA